MKSRNEFHGKALLSFIKRLCSRSPGNRGRDGKFHEIFE